MAEINKKNNNVNKPKTEYLLPEKEFKLRSSLLTQLFEEDKHIKSVYSFFIVSLVYLTVNCMVKDYLDEGRINLGFDGLVLVFGKFHMAFILWIVNNFTTVCVYYCFISWARTRYSLKEKYIKYWDHLCLSALVGYYSLSLYFHAQAVQLLKLPSATTLVLLIEVVRLLMKLYSFVRSNAPKALNKKPDDKKMYSPPGLSKLLYFLFAPTLIYRDEYPRTAGIRRRFLITTIMEVAGTVLYMSLLTQHIIFPSNKQFCMKKFTTGEIVLLTLQNSIPGILMFWSLNFLLIHSVQNFFAELLRFGDRMFYFDWWNSSTFLEFLRKWNFVVGDWIYMYIYKDVYEIVAPGRRKVALLISFIMSCIVHEWLTYYTLGVFLPAFSTMYMLGVTFFALVKVPTKTLSHVVLFYLMICFAGALVNLVAMEVASRTNVPSTNSTGYFMHLRNCIS